MTVRILLGPWPWQFSSRIIKSLLGKINLKHKNEINLERYQIKDEAFPNGIYGNFSKTTGNTPLSDHCFFSYNRNIFVTENSYLADRNQFAWPQRR